MGLWNWMRTQATGQDLDAEQARAEALDAKLRERNSDPAYLERLTPRDRDAVAEHLANQEALSANLAGQVEAAFVEGAVEGLDNMQSGVRDTLTGAVGFTLKGVLGFIPWWVWIGSALYLAWHFGLLKNILAKRP